jgi:hypothetical protein
MSEVDLSKRIYRYGGDVMIVRIALIAHDTEGRTGNDVTEKASDPRYKSWREQGHGSRFWELDAMDPRDLRARIDDAIECYVDPDAWARSASTEKAEIQALDLFYEKIPQNRRIESCQRLTTYIFPAT